MCMQDGHCPLYSASDKGHDKTVEILLQAGATVDLESKVEDYSLSLVLCHVQYIVHQVPHNIQGNTYECQKIYPTHSHC